MGFIAVLIIAVVFTALSVAIGWAATQGKLGSVEKALQTQTRSGRQVFTAAMIFVYAGLGIAVPIIFLVGNHANASAQVGGIKLTAADKQGRMLFGEHCAVCHTLAAASAVGKTGPNLDSLKASTPSERRQLVQLVLHTVQNGCLQKPEPAQAAQETCLGFGTMPADVVQGRQAQEVAGFVAKVAGHG